MKIIVAVDSNWGIGCNGGLLFKIKEDTKFFRETTKNSVVIMGKNTFESLPNGPLPNRINIVITSDTSYKKDGIIVAHSIEEAVEKASEYSDKEVFCIGGGQIYRQMLNYCDTTLVTKVDAEIEGVDTFFVNMDKQDEWYVSEISKVKYDLDSQLMFRFCTYKKKN